MRPAGILLGTSVDDDPRGRKMNGHHPRCQLRGTVKEDRETPPGPMVPWTPKPSRVLVVVAVMNLLLMTAMWSNATALLLRGGGNSPFAFLGSICFCFFIPLVLVVQYRSAFRCGVVDTAIMSILGFAGAALALFALASNIGEELMKGQPFDGFMMVFASVCLAVAAYAVLVGLLSLRWKRKLVLWQSGEPVCLNCGYNLTGNVSGICPECGQAIVGHRSPDREVDHVR